MKITKKRILRVLFRSRYYYGLGSSIISLPMVFLGLSRNLYNLIDNFWFFPVLFPTYYSFLWRAGVAIVPMAIFFGYIWTKSMFYKETIKTQVERNPYAFKLAPGRDSTMYFGQVIGQMNMLRLFKKMGTITPEEEEKYREYIKIMKHMEEGGNLRDVA